MRELLETPDIDQEITFDPRRPDDVTTEDVTEPDE